MCTSRINILQRSYACENDHTLQMFAAKSKSRNTLDNIGHIQSKVAILSVALGFPQSN